MATATRKATTRAKRDASPMAVLGKVIAASVVADRKQWTDALPQPKESKLGPMSDPYVQGYNDALRDVRDAITAKARR